MKESTVPAKKEQEVAATRDEERTLAPPVDIFENAEGLVVLADLPGVDKENVHVRVDNGVLTIEGHPKSGLDKEPLYREYQLVNFFRQFELAETVDQDNIKAEMKHGVLVVRLPKKEESKPKRIQVDVK